MADQIKFLGLVCLIAASAVLVVAVNSETTPKSASSSSSSSTVKPETGKRHMEVSPKRDKPQVNRAHMKTPAGRSSPGSEPTRSRQTINRRSDIGGPSNQHELDNLGLADFGSAPSDSWHGSNLMPTYADQEQGDSMIALADDSHQKSSFVSPAYPSSGRRQAKPKTGTHQASSSSAKSEFIPSHADSLNDDGAYNDSDDDDSEDTDADQPSISLDSIEAPLRITNKTIHKSDPTNAWDSSSQPTQTDTEVKINKTEPHSVTKITNNYQKLESQFKPIHRYPAWQASNQPGKQAGLADTGARTVAPILASSVPDQSIDLKNSTGPGETNRKLASLLSSKQSSTMNRANVAIEYLKSMLRERQEASPNKTGSHEGQANVQRLSSIANRLNQLLGLPDSIENNSTNYPIIKNATTDVINKTDGSGTSNQSMKFQTQPDSVFSIKDAKSREPIPEYIRYTDSVMGTSGELSESHGQRNGTPLGGDYMEQLDDHPRANKSPLDNQDWARASTKPAKQAEEVESRDPDVTPPAKASQFRPIQPTTKNPNPDNSDAESDILLSAGSNMTPQQYQIQMQQLIQQDQEQQSQLRQILQQHQATKSVHSPPAIQPVPNQTNQRSVNPVNYDLGRESRLDQFGAQQIQKLEQAAMGAPVPLYSAGATNLAPQISNQPIRIGHEQTPAKGIPVKQAIEIPAQVSPKIVQYSYSDNNNNNNYNNQNYHYNHNRNHPDLDGTGLTGHEQHAQLNPADLIATNYELADALYSSSGSLEQLLTDKELEAIKSQLVLNAAHQHIDPASAIFNAQKNLLAVNNPSLTYPSALISGSGLALPANNMNQYQSQPQQQHDHHHHHHHHHQQQQQQQNHHQHQDQQTHVEQQQHHDSKLIGIKQSQEDEESLSELASDSLGTSISRVNPPKDARQIMVPINQQPKQDNQKKVSPEDKKVIAPSDELASQSKGKSLVVYLNHPKPDEQTQQSKSPKAYSNEDIEAKEFDSFGLSKETKKLDVSSLEQDGPKDGLSVVVIGDAWKYKKIVLLISSKPGGPKLSPMLKDLR